MVAAVLFSAQAIDAAETRKVVLQLGWDHQFQFAGYYAAAWQGYYSEAGLEVEFRSRIEADGKFRNRTKEVAEGRAEFGIGGVDILTARDKGLPLVVLASVFQESGLAFYAKADSGLNTATDLTRLRVGRIRFGGRAAVELHAMLRAEGIDPAKVNFVPWRGGIPVLTGDLVDVVPGYSISADRLAKENNLTLTSIRPRAYGVDFYGDALFTNQGVIDNDQEMVERFVTASLRGWQYALNHSEEVADRIAADLPRKLPVKDLVEYNRDLIDPVRELIDASLIQLGHINPARWRKMHETLVDMGIATRKFDPDTFIFNPTKRKFTQLQDTYRLVLVVLGVGALIGLLGWAWTWMLRRTVALRTKELHVEIAERKAVEQQLAHAQKMEAVGRMTGGVAHEFNNILQAVLLNLQVLRRFPADEEKAAQILDSAIAASKRGGELTKQLLSFSRKRPLHPKVININDSILDIFGLLQRSLGKDITIKTKLAKDLWSANVDPGSFESAVINLAVNACSAMPKGDTLTIETAGVSLVENLPHDDGDLPVGNYVLVTVSDLGCGMSPEVLARAFEPFFTTKDVGEGTGLGLSMVYGFSRQSGGHTTIDSEPDKGTTVRMYLPATESHAIEEPDEPRTGKAEAAGNGTVLVVDDDPQVLEATTRLLKQIGYKVLEAGDGPSALDVLQQHDDIDLVFSDVVMPIGVSGIDLAEDINRDHKGIKVLLASGYPINEIDQDGMLRSRFGFLLKPYDSDELADAVRTAIEG